VGGCSNVPVFITRKLFCNRTDWSSLKPRETRSLFFTIITHVIMPLWTTEPKSNCACWQVKLWRVSLLVFCPLWPFILLHHQLLYCGAYIRDGALVRRSRHSSNRQARDQSWRIGTWHVIISVWQQQHTRAHDRRDTSLHSAL